LSKSRRQQLFGSKADIVGNQTNSPLPHHFELLLTSKDITLLHDANDNAEDNAEDLQLSGQFAPAHLRKVLVQAESR
jgi:hypothetical protein